jgi:hypothetical protein
LICFWTTIGVKTDDRGWLERSLYLFRKSVEEILVIPSGKDVVWTIYFADTDDDVEDIDGESRIDGFRIVAWRMTDIGRRPSVEVGEWINLIFERLINGGLSDILSLE